MKFFIDTDIGSDVDDALAILYALKKLPIAGITTVHGCAGKKAQVVGRILGWIGRDKDVEVHAGLDEPLNGGEIYVYGFEGNGYLNGDEQKPMDGAVEFLNGKIEEGDKVISIAPQTNLAYLLREFPDVQNRISEIYFQGGVVERNLVFEPNKEKHNCRVDPVAVDVIFASGIPLKILTTEVAKTVYFTRDDFRRLPDNQLFRAIRQNAEDYLKLRGRDEAFLYDPLTVMMITRPGFFRMETKGQISITTGVDVDRAKHELLEVLIGV